MEILRVISLCSAVLLFVYADDVKEIGLMNAHQSSTETRYGCAERPHKCVAKNAIDKDPYTYTYTDVHKSGWLEVELEEAASVSTIHLYLTDYGFRMGYYSKMNVETKLRSTDAWTSCKGVFSIKVFLGILHPHVIQCDQATRAKFLRISSEQKHGLRLREVKVLGKTGVECVPCSCRKWAAATTTYSDCRPVTAAHPCTGYCVQCEGDGETAMLGPWGLHKNECIKYKARGGKCSKHAFDGRPDEWRSPIKSVSGKSFYTKAECQAQCEAEPKCQWFRIKKSEDLKVYGGCELYEEATYSGAHNHNFKTYQMVPCGKAACDESSITVADLVSPKKFVRCDQAIQQYKDMCVDMSVKNACCETCRG